MSHLKRIKERNSVQCCEVRRICFAWAPLGMLSHLMSRTKYS